MRNGPESPHSSPEQQKNPFSLLSLFTELIAPDKDGKPPTAPSVPSAVEHKTNPIRSGVGNTLNPLPSMAHKPDPMPVIPHKPVEESKTSKPAPPKTHSPSGHTEG